MSNEVLLTGTPKTEPEMRELRAGKLRAQLDGGALRWIKWGDVEVLRAIMFLVRTPGWGTPDGNITDLSVEETAERFLIRYQAHYGETGHGVVVSVQIEGQSSGALTARSEIQAEAPFETNRSGFVILHPLDGFAGCDVRVEHANADARTLTIPVQISPGQPVMDMQSITHNPVPGLEVETRFEGDIFEMEDHRNWSDASFKTYSRPIGWEYPYILSPEQTVEQSIKVLIRDKGASEQPDSAVSVPDIRDQHMPVFALPLDTLADVTAALNQTKAMLALAPAMYLLRLDNTLERADAEFKELARLLSLTNAELEIQIILAAASDNEAGIEIQSIAKRLSDAGVIVSRASAFAKIDEQSFQPGEARPDHPSEEAIAGHLGEWFPKADLIGGTPAFFTEFNRKQPDPKLWKGLTFATTPVVHAADDASVMETLQSLPHILGSATALSGGLPLAIGPVGIGARINPYGPSPTENDPVDREGMAARDPRQRGLIAAAWIVGYLARIVQFAPERFAFGAPTGPFGLISSPQKYARSHWDDLPEGAVLPLYHVARWIALAGNADVTSTSVEGDVVQLTWERDGMGYALMANLSAKPRPMPPINLTRPLATLLTAENLTDLAGELEPNGSTALPEELGAYAVLFLGEEALV